MKVNHDVSCHQGSSEVGGWNASWSTDGRVADMTRIVCNIRSSGNCPDGWGDQVVARPLEGFRVVEVAQFTFTPSAGAVLADWGADVIKIEHAVTGDSQRGMTGLSGWRDGSFHPVMEHPNRGKRSIGLALEDPGARAVLDDIVRALSLIHISEPTRPY